MDTNVTVLSGRSTKDVELKTTANGTSVATISLAVNHGREEVSYFDIVCFSKTAENVGKYVQKGKQVIVSWRLLQRRWKTKDGESRYSVEVIAKQVQFVGSSSNNSNNSGDVVIDDIPNEPVDLCRYLFKEEYEDK